MCISFVVCAFLVDAFQTSSDIAIRQRAVFGPALPEDTVIAIDETNSVQPAQEEAAAAITESPNGEM